MFRSIHTQSMTEPIRAEISKSNQCDAEGYTVKTSAPVVAGYLLWRGADHGSSKKRGGECILIYANGLTGRDVETINRPPQ